MSKKVEIWRKKMKKMEKLRDIQNKICYNRKSESNMCILLGRGRYKYGECGIGG